MDDVDDFGLIDRTREGSARAFEILVRRHYDTMYKFAYRWCGNRPDAEDVTQNACVKLARALDGFQKQSAFSTWLYRLVINTAKDWQRQHARHHAAHGEEQAEERASGQGMEEVLFAKQVVAAVGKLPPTEKAAVTLVLAEGLSHQQAAEVMDCAESTVSWRIHEARKKLKSEFEAERQDG